MVVARRDGMGPRGLTLHLRKEAAMYPTVFDLDILADYQRRERRRFRQQADLPSPPSRLRIALAQALLAVANRLWQPGPRECLPEPVEQPS